MSASWPDPSEQVPPRPTTRAWTWLVLFTTAAAALHLVGIDWHLPHHPLSDEKVYWLQVGIARGMEVLPFDRVHAHSYPSMLGRVAEFLLPVRGALAPSTLDELRSWSAQEVLGIRVMVAILSAGIVPATWFAARRILREPWAALAAGLASISTLSVWFSSMARPHAVVVVFATATVAASLRARATGRIVDFLLAGVFAALSLGTLQSGVCACAAVAAAWWWNARPRLGRPLVGAVLAALLAFASLAVFLRGEEMPDLPASGGFGNAVLSYFGLGVHNVGSTAFDGRGFARFALAMRDYDPILAALALVGLVALVSAWIRGRADRARRAVIWTAAAHPMVYLAVFGYYGESFQRFWLPMIPFVAMLAAAGVAAMMATAATRFRPLIVAIVALFAAVQVGIVAKIAVLRVRDDTHELASTWIEAHPELAPFWVGPTVHVPLVPLDPEYCIDSPLQLKFFVPWTIEMLRLDPALRAKLGVDILDMPMRHARDRAALERDPAAWLAQLRPGVFVVEKFRDRRRAILRALNDLLAARGPVIATFDPQPLHDVGAPPIDCELDGPFALEAWFTWTLLWAERLGPEIEVYAPRR